MAVWPSEEDLLLGTSVPLTEPATPVQQRYEGRLSRARKVNSERRSVTRQTRTPAAVEKEEGGEEDVKAEVEEAAEMAMVEEEMQVAVAATVEAVVGMHNKSPRFQHPLSSCFLSVCELFPSRRRPTCCCRLLLLLQCPAGSMYCSRCQNQ